MYLLTINNNPETFLLVLKNELSSISTIFIWFDFFMYMNIILSQIDMLIIETTIDLIMILLVARHYLNLKTVAQTSLENKHEIIA